MVASVDADGVPALEVEALLDPARPVIGRAVVVDDDGGQQAEPDPARPLHRFPVAALVELPVADEAEYAPPRERDAHRDAEPVAERAARDLDARHKHAVRVVAERRVEAPEAGERL